MAQRAFFKIDGKESPVKELEYSFNRGTEEHGKPSTRVRGGIIRIKKDSIYDKGSMILWLSQPDEPKNGEIKIYQDEGQKDVLKTISFENGYIVEYREYFGEEDNRTNTEEEFRISAEIIKIDSDSEFNFEWPAIS